MDLAASPYLPFLFLPVFVVFWLAVAFLLLTFSGWFRLTRRFPDTSETAIVKLGNQSGTLGMANFSGILTLEACQGGLRVRIWKLFCPLWDNAFFVPYHHLGVTRRRRLLFDSATLALGKPEEARLTVEARTADRLAAAVSERLQRAWPETGTFDPPRPQTLAIKIFREWAIRTGLATAFFALAPRLGSGGSFGPPLIVCFLFPAIVFGIGSLIRFLRERQ